MPREIWSRGTFLPCHLCAERRQWLLPLSCLCFPEVAASQSPCWLFLFPEVGDKPCLAWFGRSMEFPRPCFCKGLKPFRLVRHCPAECDLGVLQEQGRILTRTREVRSVLQELPVPVLLPDQQPRWLSHSHSSCLRSSGKGGSSRTPFRGRAQRNSVRARCRRELDVPLEPGMRRARCIA